MDVIQGFTECWIPSRSCKIAWEAWGAIATAVGVVAALLLPSLSAWKQRQPSSRAFAKIWHYRVAQAFAAVEILFEDYPITSEIEAVRSAASAKLRTSKDHRLNLHLDAMNATVSHDVLREVAHWPRLNESLRGSVLAALVAIDRSASMASTITAPDVIEEGNWQKFVADNCACFQAAATAVEAVDQACRRYR